MGHGLGRGPPQGEPIRIARLWASLWRMSGITNARHQPRCLRVFACHNAVILAQPCVARLRVAVSDAFHRASPGTRGRAHGLCCAGMAQSWSPGEQLSRRLVSSRSPRCGRLAALNPGAQQSRRYGPPTLPRWGRLAALIPGALQPNRYGPSKLPRNGRLPARCLSWRATVTQMRALEVATLRPCGRSHSWRATVTQIRAFEAIYMNKLPIDRRNGSNWYRRR